jgi:hypothetical protein
MNSAAWVRTGLAPVLKTLTEAHRSAIEAQGTQHEPWSSRSDEPSAGCHRRSGPGYPPLSSAYKKEEVNRSFLCPVAFPPSPGWGHTSAHRRLATDWLRHWVIPHAQPISIPLRFFCRSYRHHQPVPPPSTVDRASDFCTTGELPPLCFSLPVRH